MTRKMNRANSTCRLIFKRGLSVVMAISLAGVEPAAIVWAADVVQLEGVEVVEDGVRIYTSRKTKFNTFTTSEPPRLVLELLDTEHNASSEYIAGKGKVLKRVRSGQYQREPNLISRVVLYLRTLVGYSADWEGPRLIVKLATDKDGKEALTSVAVADSAPVPAPAPRSVKSPARAKPSGAPANLSAMTKLPDSIVTTVSSELSRIARTKDTTFTGGTAPAVRRREVRKTASNAYDRPLRRDILAELSTDPIDLEFDDMDIRDVLKLMATKARINMVYGADVAGRVSIQLEAVPFNEAFTTILSMQGLVANQAGRIGSIHLPRHNPPHLLLPRRGSGSERHHPKLGVLRSSEPD